MLGLAAILLATSIVATAGNQPLEIENDLMNGVQWSPTHDYEVHDHDADLESRRRYFSLLVPVVAQEIDRDHQTQPTADQGQDRVSVVVNGDSGLVNKPLEKTNPIGVLNGETVYHADSFKEENEFKTVRYNKGFEVSIDSTDEDLSLGSPSSEDVGNVNSKVPDNGVIQANKEGEETLHGDLVLKKRDGKMPLSRMIDGTDPKNMFIDSSIRNERHFISAKSQPEEDREVITESETSYEEGNNNIFNNNEQASESDISSVSAIKNIFPEKDQKYTSETSTVSTTPLIKVHVIGKSSDGNDSTQKRLTSTPKYLREDELLVKPTKDSPITRITKAPSRPNPPELVKDVLPKTRGRVLIEVKKTARLKQRLEDSSASSTNDGSSTDDEDEEIDEEESDRQNSPEEHIDINDPQGTHEAMRETPYPYPLIPPPGMPMVPVHLPPLPPVPTQPLPPLPPPPYPRKINQRVLHHIMHALYSASRTEDEEEYPDAFLQRYSPSVFPYPAYLAIPY